MQLTITLEPTLAATLNVLAAISSDSPEEVALKLLRDAVKSAVEDPELLGIDDAEKLES
jgi:hypothetical protein